MSQFTSCPLVRMFHSHPKNNNINRAQERCLRVIYSDKQSIFIQLLVQYKCGSVVYTYLRFFTSQKTVTCSMSLEKAVHKK